MKRNREIYITDGEYALIPITEEDRSNYVELHRQLNGEKTLFLNPQCKDMMWEQTLHGETKVYSIFDNNGNYCGSMELQNPESNTPEIGIDLLENKCNKGIAVRVVKMLARRAYEDYPVDYYLIRISSKNSHSKHVFEKMGAIPIGEEESSFKKFTKMFKEIMEDRDIDETLGELKVYFNEEDDLEEEIVFRYKLAPEIFI